MTTKERRILIRDGNRLIAEAAFESGCRFFAGYPTPSTCGIYDGLVELLPTRAGVAIGAPDEASALAYCVGASVRGAKAMTATSGQGWTRMLDTMQYAIATEIPVVIAVVQHLGPSSGGEMLGAQGDVLLTEYCTSGGYTVPVFAPSTPADSYEVTTAAFHWAETLRTPVVILSDKEVSTTAEDVDYATLRAFPPVYRPVPAAEATEPSPLRPYDFQVAEEVPVFWPVGDRRKVTMTGSAHDKCGRFRAGGAEVVEVLEHLESKIAHRRADMALVRLDGDADARTLVVAYGVTARAARKGARLARERGHRVCAATVSSLFPVPEERLQAAARTATNVIVVEENMTGQYRRIIEPLFVGKAVDGVTSLARMITPQQVCKAVEETEWKAQYA